MEATSEEVVGTGEKTFDVRVILGRRDDPLLLVYGRQLIEQISKTSNKPLLLGIALKVSVYTSCSENDSEARIATHYPLLFALSGEIVSCFSSCDKHGTPK